MNTFAPRVLTRTVKILAVIYEHAPRSERFDLCHLLIHRCRENRGGQVFLRKHLAVRPARRGDNSGPFVSCSSFSLLEYEHLSGTTIGSKRRELSGWSRLITSRMRCNC